MKSPLSSLLKFETALRHYEAAKQIAIYFGSDAEKFRETDAALAEIHRLLSDRAIGGVVDKIKKAT